MPQGSHLGPNVLMYDDDVSFVYYIIILSLVFACSHILINIFINIFNLNYLKCNVMTFYRGTPKNVFFLPYVV